MYIWIKNKLSDKNSTYSLQFNKFRIASLKSCEHDCKFFEKKKNWLQIKGLINHDYVAYLKEVITFKQVSRCCLFFSGIILFWLPLVEKFSGCYSNREVSAPLKNRSVFPIQSLSGSYHWCSVQQKGSQPQNLFSLTAHGIFL